jgi:hypothetical protein
MQQPSRPTDELIEALEGMIARRMSATGETREQACDHIKDYIQTLHNG